MRYDNRNLDIIKGLHEAMQHKVWQAYDELEMIGEDCLLVSGFRTKEEQDALYAQGRWMPGQIVTDMRGGSSFHNYGLAIDVVAVGPLGLEMSQRTKLEWAAAGRYETYARIFQSCGFKWGFQMWGTDKPHFQYTVDGESDRQLDIQSVRLLGKFPDVGVARRQRRESLIDKIAIAKAALGKPYVTASRKRDIESFVIRMEYRLSRI